MRPKCEDISGLTNRCGSSNPGLWDEGWAYAVSPRDTQAVNQARSGKEGKRFKAKGPGAEYVDHISEAKIFIGRRSSLKQRNEPFN